MAPDSPSYPPLPHLLFPHHPVLIFPFPTDLPIHYALLLFPQFEILDAFGPIEALNCLARASSFPYANDLTLSVIAATLDPVSTGPLPADPKPFNVNVAQSIVPIHTFDNPPRKIDVLIVPGGFGAGPKTASGFEPDVERVVEFIREWYPKVKYLLSEYGLRDALDCGGGLECVLIMLNSDLYRRRAGGQSRCLRRPTGDYE